jgi:DNA ligase-1
MKTEYVMLAQKYKNQSVKGWLASEKLDGMRAVWDGGLSRGRPASKISWANTVKDTKETICTGLFSRGGKIIYAPNWFLDSLPRIVLDGELYMGRNSFQELVSIVKTQDGSTNWHGVMYKVFEAPGVEEFFKRREVNDFTVKPPADLDGIRKTSYVPYFETLIFLETLNLDVVEQITVHSKPELDSFLKLVVDAGGEGLMLRNPNSFWVPQRSHNLLKVKPENDAEGIVIGAVAGKGKLEGMMGALVIEFNGKTFQLSGFTEAERELKVYSEPGTECECMHFEYQEIISFKYRELTDDGIPKEARYWRKYDKTN